LKTWQEKLISESDLQIKSMNKKLLNADFYQFTIMFVDININNLLSANCIYK
jgi:hypothetical protein